MIAIFPQEKFSVFPRASLAFSLIAVGSLTCGCGGDNAGRLPIKGQVTLDGQPLERGSIAFVPEEGKASFSAGATITQGAYEIDRAKGLPPGTYKVVINAVKKTGKKVSNPLDANAPPHDEEVEAVPEKYNKKSALKADVKTDTRELDFSLTSR